VPLRHDIEGIGQQEVMARYGWDAYGPATAGSAGQLQQVMLMNHASVYSAGAYWDAQDILTHGIGHRWSANLSLPIVSRGVAPPTPWVRRSNTGDDDKLIAMTTNCCH